jgi:hypothetical protein
MVSGARTTTLTCLDVRTVVGGHRGTDGKTWAFAAPFSYLKTAAGY